MSAYITPFLIIETALLVLFVVVFLYKSFKLSRFTIETLEFRKNYEKICDPECNTVNLKQEVNNLILDCNYNLTEIRKKASPPLKSQLEKLDKLLKIGRNVFSTYTAEHFGLFFIPTQEQEKACLFNLINYYYSWDDEVWNNNENFLKILLLKYSGEEIP